MYRGFKLYRGFSLCSNMEKLHQEFSSLKPVFKNNGYPKNFIDSSIKKVLDKLFVNNNVSLTFPELYLVCVLRYTDNFFLGARLSRTIEKNIPFCKLNVVFRSSCRLSNWCRFKDSLVKNNHLCLSLYVLYLQGYLLRKNFPVFFTTASERMGTSDLRGKRIKRLKTWKYLTTCCNLTTV